MIRISNPTVLATYHHVQTCARCLAIVAAARAHEELDQEAVDNEGSGAPKLLYDPHERVDADLHKTIAGLPPCTLPDAPVEDDRGIKTRRAERLTIDDMWLLVNYAGWQTESLWDDRPVQSILEMYHAAADADFEDFQAFMQCERELARAIAYLIDARRELGF